MYRLICVLFLVLTVLGGFTVSGGSLEVSLINAVIFLALALGVTRFLEPRFGHQGLVFGMGGAFLLSLIWPFAVMSWLEEQDCEQVEGKLTCTTIIEARSQATEL